MRTFSKKSIVDLSASQYFNILLIALNTLVPEGIFLSFKVSTLPGSGLKSIVYEVKLLIIASLEKM